MSCRLDKARTTCVGPLPVNDICTTSACNPANCLKPTGSATLCVVGSPDDNYDWCQLLWGAAQFWYQSVTRRRMSFQCRKEDDTWIWKRYIFLDKLAFLFSFNYIIKLRVSVLLHFMSGESEWTICPLWEHCDSEQYRWYDEKERTVRSTIRTTRFDFTVNKFFFTVDTLLSNIIYNEYFIIDEQLIGFCSAQGEWTHMIGSCECLPGFTSAIRNNQPSCRGNFVLTFFLQQWVSWPIMFRQSWCGVSFLSNGDVWESVILPSLLPY